jgi:hypothetical protein
VQFNIDSFERPAQIVRNFRIPKADDTISFALEPKLSFTIARSGCVFIVMSTVDLDNQMRGRAKEVDDVAANRRLTPEVCTEHRKLFQRAPQRALVWRCVGSQFPGGCLAD